MQFYDTFGQCQANTGTFFVGIFRIDRINLIETVEDLVYFFSVDSAAGIADTDDSIAAFRPNAQCDGIFGFGMLDGIGQQIVDNLLHLFLVVPHFKTVGFFVEVEVDLFGAGIFQEQQVVFVQELDDIVRGSLYLHVALFLLAEVEQFGNQLAQLQAVFVDTQYLIVDIRSKVLHLQQCFYLGYNQRKRSTEFVRYIGKEAQFVLVQGFYVLNVFLFVFQ